jgi:hypothetical protein
MRKVSSIRETSQPQEHRTTKILRDNLFLDRLIEVGTKALRRGLMSGETLRAPRQQLRRHRASAFDLSTKSPVIARLSGACRILSSSLRPLPQPVLLNCRLGPAQIQKTVRAIRKNFSRVSQPVCADSNRALALPFSA